MFTSTFWVLRYRPGVPLNQRKHAPTVGRHPEVADAEQALYALPLELQLLIDIEGPRHD